MSRSLAFRLPLLLLLQAERFTTTSRRSAHGNLLHASPCLGQGTLRSIQQTRIDLTPTKALQGGPDRMRTIQVKELAYYIAFKRIKNFACVEVYPQTKVLTIFLKVDPKTVPLEKGFSRDVTNI